MLEVASTLNKYFCEVGEKWTAKFKKTSQYVIKPTNKCEIISVYIII